MTTPSGNPFVFPGMGLGQNPEHLAGNPLLQSFEMMRNAWSSMGSQMLSGGIPTPPILNVEELDRRINELRAVENWLRLNLTMLQSSIQAMEVQRATIATLQSFANMGGGAAMPFAQAPGGQEPSPLEVALGMKGSRQQTRAQEGATEQGKDAPAPADDNAARTDSAAPAAPTGVPAPHQAWWNMLQNQFNQLASAAAATLTPDTSGATPGAGAAGSAPRASDASPPAKTARRSAKTAARKAAPRKS
jgi:hypothetical protein